VVDVLMCGCVDDCLDVLVSVFMCLYVDDCVDVWMC
jgi:hypothetical protein